ncbi:hypothetical protein RUM44_007924 [Polyplax serrata]|uniref:Uncharacterized protein n=1 Tax=Polyplax serrata TaxID=468196 RepID=A0ABR1BAU0_POLSC
MSNVYKVERLKVLNYTYGLDATFHFYGSKQEEGAIREAFKRLAEESSLGTTNVTLRRDATLLVESVTVSKKSIRVGQEFSISCIAQGSVYMTFTWLKDGATINESVITRSVSMHLIYLSRGRYQYTLMIDKASLLDEGIYTCHVSDWHVQQCKGIHVHVAGPPEIRLTPMSATVEKGASLDVVCIPLNNRPKQEKFGYSWIKNRHLLKMTPGREVWEDLYLSHYNGGINTGSVLEITNIQKSATYTCQAQGIGASSELSVRVEVVNKSVVPLCMAEGKYGVAWQTTAPGMETIADCPFHVGGHARRECRLTDFNTTRWDIPNFTGCLSSDIESIYNNFTRLTIGYDVTNGSVTLANLLNQVSKRSTFLPGECERIVDILSQVLRYLNSSSMFADLRNSAGPFYNVINLLLSHERCFITDKKVVLLQNLVRTKGIIWGSLFSGTPSVFQDMTSLIVEVTKLKTRQVYNLFFPPKHKSHLSWLTDRIAVRVDTSKYKATPQESFTVVVAAYKNLTQFLKSRYLTKFEDGTDQEFEINSRLVTIELGRRRFRISPVADSFFADIELDHFVKDYDPEAWRWSCGVTEFASFRSTWDLNACTGQMVSPNTTRCRCRKTGTYAVLLISKNQLVPANSKESKHFVVLIGCGCCLIQSLLTLCLLLPYWCRRKTCLVFLKMQCCLATACAMSVFIYSVQHSVSNFVERPTYRWPFPKMSIWGLFWGGAAGGIAAVFPLVTTFLEIFLLVGLSSHLSKLLVVYTEIIQLPTNKHMKETVVCIITGLPVLAVLCNFLGYHSTGWNLNSWWILKGSMIFNVFITSAALLVVLFAFLYVSVLRKLYVLSQRSADKNKAVFRRIGLLKRGGLIFVTMIIMESASIFYINVLDVSSQYFFSSSSALLGFVILSCYILKSECSFHEKLVKSVKENAQTGEDDFSSESVINPLRFFTKQEGDAESEAAPPMRRPSLKRRICDPQTSGDLSEQFVLSETGTLRKDEGCTGTLETFISSVEGSAERRTHMSSVRKPLTSFKIHEHYLGEYVEQEEPRLQPPSLPPEDESWEYEKLNGSMPKPDVAQCYIRETNPVTSQEIITTRVCVELGVITTHQKNELTGQEVATPAIVLCSVDVEPCQSRMVEVSDTVNDAICCGGINNGGSIVLGVTGQESETMLCSNPQLKADETKGEDCSNSEKTDSSSLAEYEGERNQPEGIEDKKMKKEDDENIDGMLDRISHDLDYLLNRKPSLVSRKSSKISGKSSIKRIAEEAEEEEKEEQQQQEKEMSNGAAENFSKF